MSHLKVAHGPTKVNIRPDLIVHVEYSQVKTYLKFPIAAKTGKNMLYV